MSARAAIATLILSGSLTAGVTTAHADPADVTTTAGADTTVDPGSTTTITTVETDATTTTTTIPDTTTTSVPDSTTSTDPPPTDQTVPSPEPPPPDPPTTVAPEPPTQAPPSTTPAIPTTEPGPGPEPSGDGDTTTTDATTGAPTSSTLPPPTTTTTGFPPPGDAPPPIGTPVPPSAEVVPSNPVAIAAQAAYGAFLSWRRAADAHALVAARLGSVTRRVVALDAEFDSLERRLPGGPDGVLRMDRPLPRADPRVVVADQRVAQQLRLSTDALRSMRAAVAIVSAYDAKFSPAYRSARDRLVDAVVAEAGAPSSMRAALSASWETADLRRLPVVLAALMHVGDEYVFAAEGPDQFDCSGLTRFAWRSAGVDLVHYAITQRQQTPDVAPEDLAPADLVFRFSHPGGHVMLYLGAADLVVQAGGADTGVTVGPWGHVDGLGSPMAPPRPFEPPTPPSMWFGPLAARARVDVSVPEASVFNAAGTRYAVAPTLLAAIAAAGSGFRSDVTWTSGGLGLMGLRPGVAAVLKVDPHDVVASINGAASRLAALAGELHDPLLALAAYRTSILMASDPTAVPTDTDTRRFVRTVADHA
jgi:cell wall-associated NlpC family hydrolase